MSSDVVALTAKRLGLHPWRMIVERYGGARPAKLKRAIVSVSAEERIAWMRGVVGLEHGERSGSHMNDYDGRTVEINGRLIEHIRDEPQRAPYLQWVTAALERPLEVWRRYLVNTQDALEPRLYYLYAIAQPSFQSIVVIVGEHDLVAFNVIPFEAKDAKKFRLGELLYVSYDHPFGHCPHGCCERNELA